jgi:hypothetical protein
MSVKACLISSASSGIAARFSMASGAARVCTNCSGSTSPPMTGGNSYRWSQKHYAKNCQLKKLRRETIPKKQLCDRTLMLPGSTTTHENRIYKATFA